MLWTGLGPVRRSQKTRTAGSNARFENQAVQNQQISVQSAKGQLSRFRPARTETYAKRKNMKPTVTIIITYREGRNHVSEERPVYGCRAHHGCSRLLPRRGNLVGDPGRQRERRSHFCSKVALQALEGGLGRNEARQGRSERAFACSPTDHAVGHIPCECGTTGVCDSFVFGGQEVSGQLPPQGVHVGGSFSSTARLREIARENNSGRSGWSDSGKGALTFFDLNCADNKNNKPGGLRE